MIHGTSRFATFFLPTKVGIAAMDLRSPEMVLSQFSDNQTYVMTAAMLHRCEPLEVLFPSTMAGSALVLAVQDALGAKTKITFVARKFFNDSQGLCGASVYLAYLRVCVSLFSCVLCLHPPRGTTQPQPWKT